MNAARFFLILVSCASWAMLVPSIAFADNDASADDASDEGGAPEVPLACDGGLCDTTTGSTCAMPRGKVNGAPVAAAAYTVLLAVIARRSRRPSHRQSTERER
jgi:hypothetical protein